MTVKVDGAKELNKVLADIKKLPARSANNVIAAGLRAGARPVVKKMRGALPSNYSTLKKSINVKVKRARSPFTRIANIGPDPKKGGWYAHIVEYGTLGSRTKPLAPSTRRKRNYNPLPTGLKPVPFIRNSMDGQQAAILNAMKVKLRSAIDKQFRKLKR